MFLQCQRIDIFLRNKKQHLVSPCAQHFRDSQSREEVSASSSACDDGVHMTYSTSSFPNSVWYVFSAMQDSVVPQAGGVASESGERTRPRVPIAAPRRIALPKEKFAMARAPSPAREARALPREHAAALLVGAGANG